MNSKNRLVTLIVSAAAMALLILDAKTALQGAQNGVEIAIHTVLPTLFPFIFFSGLLNQTLLGRPIPILSWIAKLCGVPQGAESLLLLGLTSGYPVGAKVVADSYASGQLDRQTAGRMLGFCNNAGPAFIFGMLLPMFSKPAVPFLLWFVHILSALLTGILLPGRSHRCTVNAQTSKPLSLPAVLQQSLKTVGGICGWVILFRMLLAFCERWFLWRLDPVVNVLISGLFELSNGCIFLHTVSSEAMRLILSACMLSCGGVCVAMQTLSVTKDLGTGMYLPGKIIQTAISFLLVTPVVQLMYADNFSCMRTLMIWGTPICMVCIAGTYILLQKSTGILRNYSV